jgi:hypothetical protein
MINSLSNKVEQNNTMIQQMALKVTQIEEGRKNTIEPSPKAPPPPPPTSNNEAALADIRSNIARLEINLREMVSKERIIIENTVMAKAEELVKIIVSEKVSSETQLIASEIKMMMNELRDQDSDTISVAQSEIVSVTQKKKGGKKTYDL